MGYLMEYITCYRATYESHYDIINLPDNLILEMARCAGSYNTIGCGSSGYSTVKSPEEMGNHKAKHGFEYNERMTKILLDSDFKISKYPITQAIYKAVTNTNPSTNKGDMFPVENVTYNDAINFCNILNNKYRNDIERDEYFDLPTEAQWEIACRAGTTTAFNRGTDLVSQPFYLIQQDDELDEIGWYLNNSESKTHAVGSKKPNYWGIYDMHGNVYEWCKDWYAEYPVVIPEKVKYWDYISGMEQTEIKDYLVNPIGPKTGKFRVIRGGSFKDLPAKCRSSYRDGANPDCSFDNIGFRVVLVKKQTK